MMARCAILTVAVVPLLLGGAGPGEDRPRDPADPAVVEQLWSQAVAFREERAFGAMWQTVDRILRIAPEHEAAQGLVDERWVADSEFGRSLYRLITIARRGTFSSAVVAGEDAGLSPRLILPSGQTVAADFLRQADGGGAVTVGYVAGRFSRPEQAANVFLGFIAQCEQALPPGWVCHGEEDRRRTFRAPRGDVLLSVQLTTVTYQGQTPPIEAQLSIEIAAPAPPADQQALAK